MSQYPGKMKKQSMTLTKTEIRRLYESSQFNSVEFIENKIKEIENLIEIAEAKANKSKESIENIETEIKKTKNQLNIIKMNAEKLKKGNFIVALVETTIGSCGCSIHLQKGDLVRVERVDKHDPYQMILCTPLINADKGWVSKEGIEREFKKVAPVDIKKAKEAFGRATAYKFANESEWKD